MSYIDYCDKIIYKKKAKTLVQTLYLIIFLKYYGVVVFVSVDSVGIVSVGTGVVEPKSTVGATSAHCFASNC
ncbi:MAG: hypothetical protein WCL02_04260 [bacterium]